MRTQAHSRGGAALWVTQACNRIGSFTLKAAKLKVGVK